MKSQIFTLLLLVAAHFTTSAQLHHPARDAEGRHQVQRGFVVITGDGMGEVFYTQDDYHRMAYLGSNYQVIRLDPTKLDADVDPDVKENYLMKLDTLVNFGRNVGIKSAMKLTLYGLASGDFLH